MGQHHSSTVEQRVTGVSQLVADSGTYGLVSQLSRSSGIPRQTFYRWKKQFAGLGLQELRELRSLRHENSQLKKVVVDLTLDRHILQEIVRKKL